MKNKLTLKEAVEQFVNEFNHIPQELIKKAYPDWYEELTFLSTELTCSNCGSTEYTAEGAEEEGEEDILTCMDCGDTDFNQAIDFPMWGTFFNPKSSIDAHWIKENLEIMQELGIWVIEEEECGILLGMNSAGHDFYEAYWTPLYKARGFKWHDEEYEFLENMKWVNGFELDNEKHVSIAKKIFKNVENIDETQFEDYQQSEDTNTWHDANLHSLVSDLLYNGFTMEQIESDFMFMYCKEEEQYIVLQK